MTTPPDPGWLDYLKMIFGYTLLLILAALVAVIALGHVEQQTSYGLMPLITASATLSGGFMNWCFGKKD